MRTPGNDGGAGPGRRLTGNTGLTEGGKHKEEEKEQKNYPDPQGFYNPKRESCDSETLNLTSCIKATEEREETKPW